MKTVWTICLKIIFGGSVAIGNAYAQGNNNSYDATTIFLKKYTAQTDTTKYPKRECTIDFDINAHLHYKTIKKMKEKWQRHNTGNYVFILFTDINGGLIPESLVFVKNNKAVTLLPLDEGLDSFRLYRLQNSDQINKKLTKRIGYWRSYRKLNYFLPEKTLNTLLKEDWHTSCYCNQFEVLVEFNNVYNYVSFLQTKVTSKCHFVQRRTDMNPWFIYTYGLLMLPDEMVYTDKVIEKIFEKYKEVWECISEKSQQETTINDNNLTLLEKAVGKEKLECLDKYLVWDANVSK